MLVRTKRRLIGLGLAVLLCIVGAAPAFAQSAPETEAPPAEEVPTEAPATEPADVETTTPEEPPEETTTAPEEPTAPAEEPTEAPEETTTAPEEETPPPEETTTAPEEVIEEARTEIFQGSAMKLENGALRIDMEAGSITLEMPDNVLIMDAANKDQQQIADIPDGGMVYAYAEVVGDAPHKGVALAILFNIPEGYTPPAYDELIASCYIPETENLILLKGVAEPLKTQRIRLTDDDGAEYILRVNENTAVLDYATKKHRDHEDIEDGERVYAYVSDNMSDDKPPVTDAYVILIDVDHEFSFDDIDKNVIEAETRQKTVAVTGSVQEINGQRVTIASDGDTDLNAYLQTITLQVSSNTILVTDEDGSKIDLADIKEGDEIEAYIAPTLIWHWGSAPEAATEVVILNASSDVDYPSYRRVETIDMSDAQRITSITTDWGDTLEFKDEHKLVGFENGDDLLDAELHEGNWVLVWDETADRAQEIDVISTPRAAYPEYYVAATVEATAEGFFIRAESGALLELGVGCEIINMAGIAELVEGDGFLVWRNENGTPTQVLILNI